MARECFPEGLYLEVTAPEIARVGVTGGVRAASASYDCRRLRATAEVRLIVRRRKGEIHVAAHPVVREEHAAFGDAPRRRPGGWIRRRSSRRKRHIPCEVLRKAWNARKSQKR